MSCLKSQLALSAIAPESQYEMYLVSGFFDESQDENSQFYTVAGFIGNQLVTSILELRWKDMLDKYELEYFKASELSAGTGQFQKFRDNPSDYNWRKFSQREKDIFDQIKKDFTDVIISCGDGLYGISAVVILPDLERLRKEYANANVLPLPYFICSNMVMVEAGSEMLLQNAGKYKTDPCFLRPIFDEHEEYSGRAKNAFDFFRHKNPKSGKYLLAPHYESEHTYRTLQAADNLAFEVRKLAFTVDKKMPIRQSMKRLAENGNLIQTYKFDYDALKMVADAQLDLAREDIREKIGKTIPLISLRETATEEK